MPTPQGLRAQTDLHSRDQLLAEPEILDGIGRQLELRGCLDCRRGCEAS